MWLWNPLLIPTVQKAESVSTADVPLLEQGGFKGMVLNLLDQSLGIAEARLPVLNLPMPSWQLVRSIRGHSAFVALCMDRHPFFSELPLDLAGCSCKNSHLQRTEVDLDDRCLTAREV